MKTSEILRGCCLAGLFGAMLLPLSCRKEPGKELSSEQTAASPRIVSFSPALTDMLYDMGLGHHVVGVTTYCTPPESAHPPVVGDRSRVSAEPVLAVRPDLLVVQQNPADFGAIQSLSPHIRVEHFEIETLEDIAAAAQRLGTLCGQEDLGLQQRQAFEDKLEQLQLAAEGKPREKTLFVMGYERPNTGGGGTFIDEMISVAGGVNAPSEQGYSGWKTLNRENILAMNPDVIICQISPGQEDAAIAYWNTLAELPAVRSGKVFVVTDRRWTIPSLRSVEYIESLFGMIHSGEDSQP